MARQTTPQDPVLLSVLDGVTGEWMTTWNVDRIADPRVGGMPRDVCEAVARSGVPSRVRFQSCAFTVRRATSDEIAWARSNVR